MNIPAGFEIESQTDERIVLVKKTDKDWVPVEGEAFCLVDSFGKVVRTSIHAHRDLFLDFGNCFPTQEMALKAAKLMRRSNHIIRACLLVDPEFEPDWEPVGNKYYPYFNFAIRDWDVGTSCSLNINSAYVSTKEKCHEVCALLTKWGIE